MYTINECTSALARVCVKATKELQSILLFATRPQASGAPATPRSSSRTGSSHAILGLEAAEELGLRSASTALSGGLAASASEQAIVTALTGSLLPI